MDKIFEAYGNNIMEEHIEYVFENYENMHEAIVTTVLATALATGVFLKMLDKAKDPKGKPNKPRTIDWIAGFLKFGMEDFDGNVDIRDIKKYAYEGYADPNIVVEAEGKGSKFLLKTIKSAKKKGAKFYAKTLGKLVGRLAKRQNLSKADLDKIVSGAE
jgi:hypothetical protein